MFDYELIKENNTIRITGMRGSETRVYVPDCLAGHPVTEIGPYAFSGSRITLLDLPQSIRLCPCFHRLQLIDAHNLLLCGRVQCVDCV